MLLFQNLLYHSRVHDIDLSYSVGGAGSAGQTSVLALYIFIIKTSATSKEDQTAWI